MEACVVGLALELSSKLIVLGGYIKKESQNEVKHVVINNSKIFCTTAVYAAVDTN